MDHVVTIGMILEWALIGGAVLGVITLLLYLLSRFADGFTH